MAIIRRPESRPSGRLEFDPFEMMRDMLRFEPFRELTRGAEEAGGFVPRFDVKESKDAFEFRADLPGVKEEDLDVSLAGNRLTISGKREAEKKDEGETYYTYERNYGSFSRTFTLPDEADREHVDASLDKGELVVRLPKRKESQARRIDVRGGQRTQDKGIKA